MKRALSLIIVLAMVLCMIPFSAFAAEWNVADDFVDGVINLNAENEYTVSYLWTATEEGDLEIVAEAVVPELEEGEEMPEPPVAVIKVDGTVYTGAIHVLPNESYEISFESENGGSFTVYTKFTGLPGTESCPYEMWNPAVKGEDGIDFPANNSTTTIEIASEASVYYMLRYYQGHEVTITGNGVKVDVLGKTFGGSEASFVTMAFGSDPTTYKDVLVKFTNKSAETATYEVTAVRPNSIDAPEVVTDGTYTAQLAAQDDGYFYSYIAEAAGIVNISVSAVDAEGNALPYVFAADNKTAEIYGDRMNEGTAAVAVSAGDEVCVMVNTANTDPENWYITPAGTVSTTFEFVEPSTAIELVLGDNAGITGGEYTYTATEAGNLTVAVTGMLFNGEDATMGLYQAWFANNFAFSVNGVPSYSNTAEAIAVEAGDVVTVSLAYTQLIPAEFSAVINLSMGEDIEGGETEDEEGTMGNPIVITELDWSVVNSGTFDKYYTYTATEAGIIKVSSVAGDLSVSSTGFEEVKQYDSNTYYAVVSEGDTLTINTWAMSDVGEVSCSAEIVDALPEANGSSAFPYVIDALPYDAINTDPDYSKFYSYTATSDVELIFTGDIYSVGLEINGEWLDLGEDGKLAVSAGDVVSICLYADASVQIATPVVVATFNDVEYYDLQTAINDAALVATPTNKATVNLTAADVTVSGCLTLLPNVILNLQANTLRVDYLVGLKGSAISATTMGTDGVTGGKLYVPQENVMLSSSPALNASNQAILPIWDVDHYAFGLMLITNYGLERNETENGYAKVKFRMNSNNYFKGKAGTCPGILADGSSDNDVSVIVRVSYTSPQAAGDIAVSTDYVYDDGLVAYCWAGNYLTAEMTDCNNYLNISFSIIVLTDAGVAVIHNF